MYIVGFDGGGTKTHCVIGTIDGKVVAEGFGGPANYQTVGQERAKDSLIEALNKAINKVSLTKEEIKHYSFGLAGADDAYDIANIDKFVSEIAGDTPYDIYHDSWIGLRSASNENIGVVAICGTGAGFSGRRRDGKEVQLRNQSFEIGNYGGGGDLSSEALHSAFRSDELTGEKTLLEGEIPKLFGVEDLDKVSEAIRSNSYMVEERVEKKIPPLVFELANKGDEVCIDLLKNMGKNLGRYSLAVIKRLELEDELDIPIILIGSLYKGSAPYMLEAMEDEIKSYTDKARLIKPELPPAYGAYYLALDKLR